MLTIEQARVLLAQNVRALEPVDLALAAVAGLRLADAPRAQFDLPPADVSAMDGYAARAEDLGAGPLPVAGDICAGMPQIRLAAGTIARIQTGAEIPIGADVVIPQEKAVSEPGGCVRLRPSSPGSFIRKRGEVCSVGEILSDAGEMITPHLLGLLASAGPALLKVTPRPRIVIVTTGSELVGLTERPGQGKIRDGNACMLRALAMSANLPVSTHERVPDLQPELLSAVSAAAGVADIIVTSGGVSVGDYDLVRRVVEELGGEVLFHGVAIRPGKPILAARLGSKWLVGLPGNPLSALVVWRVLVRPIVEALAGDTKAFDDPTEEGTVTEVASNTGDRMTFAPAFTTLDGRKCCLRLIPWKGSHDLYAIRRANSLAILPAGTRIEPGGTISFLRL